MKYTLNELASPAPQEAYRRLFQLLATEQKDFIKSILAGLGNAATNLVGPLVISYTIDTAIQQPNFQQVLLNASWLLLIYLGGAWTSYQQIKIMGLIGRQVLFDLRNQLFLKLQTLPLTFFNQNKSGDLISRINNDTDKLNQFFAQALVQFMGNILLTVGAGLLLLVLHWWLGIMALLPALGVFITTRCLAPWMKRKNRQNLQKTGELSGHINENLSSFRVIIAFSRQDYFLEKFAASNQQNYQAAVSAGLASGLLTPLYNLATNTAQIITVGYGLYLVSQSSLTIGTLIGFFMYLNNFYNPLRQLAAIWNSMQLALAALDRIYDVLRLESDMPTLELPPRSSTGQIEFREVSFGYGDNTPVLQHISFSLARGGTYALVGPTGGGKTTTASLMARLYDPTSGCILLDGCDLRTYSSAQRVQKIGFILQDPLLFSGTVQDNLLYGSQLTTSNLPQKLADYELTPLLQRFDQGLDTPITPGRDNLSLGQKQLIAFMRAVLRAPELLILDEATANIDTVTEQLLEEMLNKLPATTTKVIIAHRLNTIKRADAIYFVNNGQIVLAGSMDHALQMLVAPNPADSQSPS